MFAKPPTPRRLIVTLAILATAALIAGGYFFGLTFIRPDEPLYIGIPLDMSRHHSFLVPLDHGAPDFVKPPLVYWLELASFSVFGRNATPNLRTFRRQNPRSERVRFARTHERRG